MGLGDKIRRGREALHVLSAHAADMASRKVLASCYATILRTTTDTTEVAFRLRLAGQVFPFRMCRSDLFTIAEILHEKQYALETPLPERPVIVDGGANVGVAALWFLAHHPGATLHAFEPEPRNFGYLSANVGSLPGVTVNQAAIGAAPGSVELHLAEHGAVHSVKDVAVGQRTVSVECVTLADYLERHGVTRVDLLKLDVEGSEADVVEGLGDRLDDVGVIVGEMHERLVDAPALYARLEARGFRRVKKVYYGDGEADGVHAFEMARTS